MEGRGGAAITENQSMVDTSLRMQPWVDGMDLAIIRMGASDVRENACASHGGSREKCV